jgi:hypothetical protein
VIDKETIAENKEAADQDVARMAFNNNAKIKGKSSEDVAEILASGNFANVQSFISAGSPWGDLRFPGQGNYI